MKYFLIIASCFLTACSTIKHRKAVIQRPFQSSRIQEPVIITKEHAGSAIHIIHPNIIKPIIIKPKIIK